MSLGAVHWALNEARGINPTQRLMLVALADFANPETGIAEPTVATMASRLEVSVSTVRRCMRDLQAKGYITYEGQTGSDGRQLSNRYRIWDETTAACPTLGTPCQNDSPPCQSDSPPVQNDSHPCQNDTPAKSAKSNNDKDLRAGDTAAGEKGQGGMGMWG